MQKLSRCVKSVIKKNSGFTLIELLLVAGILAILILAVIFILNPEEQLTETRETTRQSQMIAISRIIYLAVIGCDDPAVCGKVELALSQCETIEGNPEVFIFNDECAALVGMDKAPKDPLGGYYTTEDVNGRVRIGTPALESKWCNAGSACELYNKPEFEGPKIY